MIYFTSAGGLTDMIFPDRRNFWWTLREWCIGPTSPRTFVCGRERMKCSPRQRIYTRASRSRDSFNKIRNTPLTGRECNGLMTTVKALKLHGLQDYFSR